MESVPEGVLRFIDAHIGSVPALEALLLLWQERDRSWTVDQLAERVYQTPVATERMLLELRRHALVASEAGQWRFAGDEAMDAAVAQVSDAYRRYLTRIATYIHQNASTAVRAFARAFEFKKEP